MENNITEPLLNGAQLPTHPHDTTSKRIVSYGAVHDATDGRELSAGLHASEISGLMRGSQLGLSHLYRYALRNGHIYHTRPSVIINVVTEDVVD